MRDGGWLLPILATGALIALWKAGVTLGGLSPFVLPPPEAVLAASLDLLARPATWAHLGSTATACLAGFAIAALVGMGLGILLARVPWCDRAFYPLVVAFQGVPKIALVPLFILWLGFGMATRIAIAATIALFPVVVATRSGLRAAEARHHDVLRLMGARPGQRLVLVDLPGLLPHLLTGLEIAIMQSFAGATVAEFLAGRSGLGHLVVVSLQELRVAEAFGVVLIQSALGLCFYALVPLLRRLLLPWQAAAVQRY
ncbi:MAG: ABC transporter permease [Rhodobacter sp. CACIA14H1]|nr:MAG: ABC transporter permease [Rhodobacter sp. CACIA14H1]